ncbi:hypothetical protein [Nonomuraea wenchangensis]|uniref:Uncharacterized protein n=1 Tax=Nonomuraea wenchangensis TaxID=568860 RepID=A0A1I0LGH7_9ACTN|nr:hypothetical protein [Nonomuraea wenchangensis]SEU38687.1 hypothetical protein SAMN05421811_1164 [Nonomuraea wenchangensis]
MIRKIGTVNSNVQKGIPVHQIDSKRIEEAFASFGNAMKAVSDNFAAQAVFGLALNDFDAVASRLAGLDTDLVMRIHEAAVDLALVADLELKGRGV